VIAHLTANIRDGERLLSRECDVHENLLKKAPAEKFKFGRVLIGTGLDRSGQNDRMPLDLPQGPLAVIDENEFAGPCP